MEHDSYENRCVVCGFGYRRAGRMIVPATLLICVAVAAGYAANERAGTIANVEVIETTKNLMGGFLAVGMSADQPGFVLFSALDQERVQVEAEQSMNAITGTYTIVRVMTPRTEWRKRLRGPVVVTVSEDGSVTEAPVDWSFADFKSIREGVDCAHPEKGEAARCGAPFADLADAFADWPAELVPASVHSFLKTLGYPKQRPSGG